MKPASRPISAGKQLRYKLDVLLLRALAWMIQRMSRRFVLRLGRLLGWLAYYVAAKPRRIALANLDVAYGDSKSPQEKQRIARAGLQNFAGTFLTLFWAPRLTADSLRDYIECDEATIALQRELRLRGKGVIYVTLHFGDWELLAQAATLFGIQLTVVMEQLRNAQLAEFLTKLRAHGGHRIISQTFATAKLLKALKRGEGIAITVDLNSIPRLGGVWLNFFGTPVFNTPTAAILALRTGARVVGIIALPLPNGRFRVVCSPEIVAPLTGNEEADILTLSQKHLDYCETVIREHPEHWLWTYRRWKFRPTEEQGRYPFYSHPIKKSPQHNSDRA